MQNILYLDDYINLYNNRLNKIIVFKPYKNTLRNGIIIDRDRFIKVFNKMIIKNKLKRGLFQESISVIINSEFTKEDKRSIKEILNELNYNKVNFINENKFFNNSNIYINYNESYFTLSYNTDKKREIISYKNNKLNKELLLKFLNNNNKQNKIFFYGKNAKNIYDVIKNNKNLYLFSDNNNLILTLLIHENVKV